MIPKRLRCVGGTLDGCEVPYEGGFGMRHYIESATGTSEELYMVIRSPLGPYVLLVET